MDSKYAYFKISMFIRSSFHHSSRKIALVLFLIFFCFSVKSTAQYKKAEKLKKYNLLYNVIIHDDALKQLSDSIPLYVFNFKIAVKKTGKKLVVKVTATDSLAYKLFPSYKKYYSFDFTDFLNDNGEVLIMLPVMIINSDNHGDRTTNKVPLLDINNVIKLLTYGIYVNEEYNNVLLLKTLIVERLNITKN